MLPPTSRSFRLGLLGVGFLLFAAGHADADPVYGFAGQAAATPGTAAGFASSIQQEAFRYDRDVACYYECGAAGLLSWSMPDDGDALDSTDGAVVVAGDEDFLTNWGMRDGRDSSVHVALEEGIERNLLLPR